MTTSSKSPCTVHSSSTWCINVLRIIIESGVETGVRRLMIGGTFSETQQGEELHKVNIVYIEIILKRLFIAVQHELYIT